MGGSIIGVESDADKKLYHVLKAIKRRCHNEKSKDFKYYGARGISVCDRWRESFINFKKDMGEKPTPKHQIDRIDNDGDYCKENCHWATVAENQRNRRNSKTWVVMGIKYNTVAECAKENKMSEGMVRKWCDNHKNGCYWEYKYGTGS